MLRPVVQKVLFFAVIFFVCFPAPAQQRASFNLKEGDLLFQDLDCGPLCDAIEKVTTGHRGAAFTHVGLVILNKTGQLLVLEAIGDSVRLTPARSFLNRNLNSRQQPKVAVGRLKKPYRHLIPAAVARACTYRGAAYDHAFATGNNAVYCSELIYLAFWQAPSRTPLFELEPMTYKDPETGLTFEPWADYFKKLELEVPEGDPGINPGGISRSPVLKMYYPYGRPDKPARAEAGR